MIDLLSGNKPRTLVFFESPHRLAASLADLASAFGSERPAAVCRELTKLHEEIARGSLGYPWVFAELTGQEVDPPSRESVMDELAWIMDRAEEHMGEDRAGRYLRKFYPWYLDQLDVPKVVRSELCQTAGLDRAREIVAGIRNGEPVAV